MPSVRCSPDFHLPQNFLKKHQGFEYLTCTGPPTIPARMPTIMAQLASDTNSEGRIDNALLTRNSISNRSGFTSQPHADPSIPSEIFISQSRSRAMTESEVQKSQRPKHEKPKSASICSLSDETRQLLYTWHPFHKDPEVPKDQGSTSKPRYVEKASYADGDSDPEPEGITTPTKEWGHQLTPLTNTSSERYCFATDAQPLTSGMTD